MVFLTHSEFSVLSGYFLVSEDCFEKKFNFNQFLCDFR